MAERIEKVNLDYEGSVVDTYDSDDYCEACMKDILSNAKKYPELLAIVQKFYDLCLNSDCRREPWDGEDLEQIDDDCREYIAHMYKSLKKGGFVPGKEAKEV